MVTYWLDLFTGTTWEKFRKAGAQVTGFRERRRRTVEQIAPGDNLLCYVTGVMRWVGALEVIGPSTSTERIWSTDDTGPLDFPARLNVKPCIMLDPEYGVPMEDLEGSVTFYRDASDKGGYRGFLRQSPVTFSDPDGPYLYALLKDAKANPTYRKVDPKKLERVPTYKVKKGKGAKIVTVPESEGEDKPVTPGPGHQDDEGKQPSYLHTEIQYHLLKLGSDMGLGVWVASNDRSREFNGTVLGTIPRMVTSLPTQFNAATQRTIELIDILWLQGNSIVAAFEIESTTSVYSGLLRMSDLLALQPNLDIKLYIVAPDDRSERVKKEILRPTFELRAKPLSTICGYLPFSTLMEKVKGIQGLGLAGALSPDFLENMAEYFDAEDGT